MKDSLDFFGNSIQQAVLEVAERLIHIIIQLQRLNDILEKAFLDGKTKAKVRSIDD